MAFSPSERRCADNFLVTTADESSEIENHETYD